jgi:hypothetical protein
LAKELKGLQPYPSARNYSSVNTLKDFDFKTEYERTGSLDAVVQSLAAIGIKMSRNTARSRIKAAGGEIKPKHIKSKNYVSFTIRISTAQSRKLTRLGKAMGLSRSEVVRMAIAVHPSLGEPLNNLEYCPVNLEVHVTPDTLEQLGTDSLRAKRVRVAIDFVDLRKLRAVAKKTLWRGLTPIASVGKIEE